MVGLMSESLAGHCEGEYILLINTARGGCYLVLPAGAYPHLVEKVRVFRRWQIMSRCSCRREFDVCVSLVPDLYRKGREPDYVCVGWNCLCMLWFCEWEDTSDQDSATTLCCVVCTTPTEYSSGKKQPLMYYIYLVPSNVSSFKSRK